MRAEAQPTGQQMMLSINAWSSVYLLLAMTITGEGVSFCDFCTRHPIVLVNVSLLSACAAVGQLFIYTTVSKVNCFLFVLIILLLYRYQNLVHCSCRLLRQQGNSLQF